MYSGYAADVGRTWHVGPLAPSGRQKELFARWRQVRDSMIAECRPGRTIDDLRTAFEKYESLTQFPIAHGLGLGYEPPIVGGIGPNFAPQSELSAGMVIVIQPYVWKEGVGGILGKETVLINGSGHEVLTRFPYGVLAG